MLKGHFFFALAEDRISWYKYQIEKSYFKI